jgi:hypothetical protein
MQISSDPFDPRNRRLLFSKDKNCQSDGGE